MESGKKNLVEKTTAFIALLSSPIFFFIYPFCVTTQSSLKPSFPLTDR